MAQKSDRERGGGGGIGESTELWNSSLRFLLFLSLLLSSSTTAFSFEGTNR